MTAPRRIIDEPAVREEIRDAVRRVRQTEPAYDVASAIARFESTLAAGSVGAAKASWSLATKLVLLSGAALLVGSATYAFSLHRAASHEIARPAPAVAAPVSAPESAPARETVAVEAAESSVASSTASSNAVDSLPAAPAPKPRPTVDPAVEREREVKHLVALQRLAGSDPAGAIDLAKSGHAEFPRGVLFQEREIILVEALAKVGRESEARSRAIEFVKRYPKSPAAPRLRSLADVAP